MSLVPAKAATSIPGSIDSLYKEGLKRPWDVTLAFAYVQACEDAGDYEGAIGALERVLFYVPENARVKTELGILYAKLHSNQMARSYLGAALSEPTLDAASRNKIETLGTTVDDGNVNRLFGVLQTGLRYQSNAAFNPDNNLLRISNQDYVFNHPQDRGADGNAFATAQIGYDYDLGNQRGDTIEARFTGYGTRQFHLTDLDVGLYDVSVGPRLAIAPTNLPTWTVKPYAVGGQVFLAGSRYLSSAGVGIVATLPMSPNLSLEPGVEFRSVRFPNVSVFSSLNSGNTASASIAGEAVLNDNFNAFGRFYYTRDNAAVGYQSSDNYAEEFALTAQFAAPLPSVKVPWTLSPYVKLLQVRFDDPNPFIDATATQRDNELQFGIVFDTPINDRVGLVTNIQQAYIASDIPNYRLRNFSISTGPTVRF